MRNKVKNIILTALQNLQEKEGFLPFSDFDIKRPENEEHGDYSANVALKSAKSLKQNPRDIAETIKKEILSIDKEGIFERIEIAGAGFLNFFLSDNFFSKNLNEAIEKKDKFGSSNIGNKKRVLVEFISANPTGELHLGHGRGAFFGDALCNILSFLGYEVTREFYVNDAKASTQIQELGKTALGKGEAYKTEKLQEKIEKIKDLLKDAKDEAEAGSLLAKELLEDIKDIVENKLNIKFDNWFSEQKELYDTKKVDQVYEFLKSKGLIYEKEGAEWIALSRYGDSEDRVILRSDQKKSPTYLLPDIAYHKNKIERGYDKLINIWGADHQGHVKSMQAVMKIFGFENKLDIFITQMVSLKEEGEKFKLSKRKGKIVSLKWLVDEVGLDPARFFYLLKSIDTQMEFDICLAKEQSDKNPVFYVQYAHARIASIFKKAEKEGFSLGESLFDISLCKKEEERKLAFEVLKFPEIVEDISFLYNVQNLAHYTLNLAKKFHSFYNSCRVLGNEDESIDKNRLLLAKATKQTIKNALSLMGVSAPEKM